MSKEKQYSELVNLFRAAPRKIADHPFDDFRNHEARMLFAGSRSEMGSRDFAPRKAARMLTEIEQRCDAIEECYEFMLSYAYEVTVMKENDESGGTGGWPGSASAAELASGGRQRSRHY